VEEKTIKLSFQEILYCIRGKREVDQSTKKNIL